MLGEEREVVRQHNKEEGRCPTERPREDFSLLVLQPELAPNTCSRSLHPAQLTAIGIFQLSPSHAGPDTPLHDHVPNPALHGWLKHTQVAYLPDFSRIQKVEDEEVESSLSLPLSAPCILLSSSSSLSTLAHCTCLKK